MRVEQMATDQTLSFNNLVADLSLFLDAFPENRRRAHQQPAALRQLLVIIAVNQPGNLCGLESCTVWCQVPGIASASAGRKLPSSGMQRRLHGTFDHCIEGALGAMVAPTLGL
jgi:hypothetical protein